MNDHSTHPPTGFSVLRSEAALGAGALTTVIFLFFGERWLGDLDSSGNLWFALMFSWLFAAMLWLSFSVVRHAECLAIQLGEPYGTLILTLAVISIEVIMISAVTLTGDKNPTLARDTMFAVLMIVLNGMVGITLLLGGLRHHEQEYNLHGANSYLSLLIPFSVLSLVLPRFTESTPDASASKFLAIFLIAVSIVLYGIFLAIQTMRHRAYFTQPGRVPDETKHSGLVVRSIAFHALLLVLCMVPIVVLSKKMARLVDHGIETIGAPEALGGFLVAVLVLSPEGMGAVRAALNNRLQRSMNICLGSALATIGLTIPAILFISLGTGIKVELGLEPVDIILLLLTLAVCTVNFGRGRTNVLQGFVHLLLFATYIVMIFD